ncbi:MAG TPA: protein phosphatase 2C domain-containing protein [Ktedonobacteraceae bacterium]|nr:protein phosphatase 2C domain-containing protein [Ktedonobacteraceae bacterium]
MGKAGMYCVMALLLPITILAGAINPERAGHISQTPTIQTHSRVPISAQSLVVNQEGSHSGQVAAPTPHKIPPLVGLEAYSLQPEHGFGFYGSGFAPGELVEALLANQDGVPSPRSGLMLARSYANAGGNVAGHAYIPLLPSGDYALLFVGLQSKMPFIVNLNIRGFTPWVMLSDYAPPPHSMMGFSGQDFAPGEPVLVYLNHQGKQPIARIKADSTGRFENKQAWKLPDVSGKNTLIFVGTYSGTVATAAFIPLPPTPPTPTPPSSETQGVAQEHSTQSLLGGHRSIQLSVASAAISTSAAAVSSFLQDPVMLALLFLGLWCTLCLLLILPLVMPRRRKQQSEEQAINYDSGTSEGSIRSQIETDHVLSSSPPPIVSPSTLNQGTTPEQPANFCPWCGLRNTTRSNHCAGCKRDLPQLPPQRDRTWQQSSWVNALSPHLINKPPPTPPSVSSEAQQPFDVVLSTAQISQVNDRSLSQQHTSPALDVLVSAQSDRGRKRADRENEDDFLVVTGCRRVQGGVQPFGLFVVADGMGGHDDGQKASHLAIETIFKDLVPILIREDIPTEGLPALLQGAIQNANWRLYSQNEQEHSNIGATVTAALVAGSEAAICNVGDSRVYLLSLQSLLHRVTVDHSIVESLVVAGIIQREDVYTHPKRNLIFRSMGQRQRIQVDTFRQPLIKGDQLLLCSDGLWEMVRDNEIEQTLRQFRDMDQARGRLIELANEHGGLDNITAILVEMIDEVEATNRPIINRIESNSVSADQTQRGLSLYL